jgi:predicted nucleic acid-binding protein
MKYYADTSFIASLLLASDTRHALAVSSLDALPELPGLPLTPFGLLEIRNVFARMEWKGVLHRAESEALMRDLKSDAEAGFFSTPPLHSYEWMQAGMHAVATITPQTGTRTLDALHVALARLHGAKVFLSFDANQRRAAQAAGLKILPLDLTV